MNNGKSFLEKCEEYFTSGRREEGTTRFFIRGLIAFSILKCLTIWSAADVLLFEKDSSLPTAFIGKLLLLPSLLAIQHDDLTFAGILIALLVLLFIRPNYISNLILFWIAINLFKIRFPVTNGSDYVLLVLCLYAVGLSYYDFRDRRIQTVNISLFNLFRLLVCIQVAFIYLISAWDKLLSPVWRSGEAFQFIGEMDTVVSPLASLVTRYDSVSLLLSWTTIIFELAFVVLIWQKRTRLIIVCVGVIFHLVIWFMLSLPDFALIMIVSYLIFLKDSDLRPRLRPQLL
jgi:hypothetical protein